jgi:hypothetical protein
MKKRFIHVNTTAALLLALVTSTAGYAGPGGAGEAKTSEMEKTAMVGQLSRDLRISANVGYTVEKRKNQLYINGKLQSPEVAAKYLSMVKQDDFKVTHQPTTEFMLATPDNNTFRFMKPVVPPPDPNKPGC